MPVTVQAHYGAEDIVARLLAAIPWSRQGGESLSARQIYPFDQFHGRELLATQDHVGRLAPRREDRILDIGSGIGGPARYAATEFGCHVSGIDITPGFVAAATELSLLCGLQDQVAFVAGDAARMPFDDAAFDGAFCFYVGMNLPDTAAVLREGFRVLKPGGRLIWTEVTSQTGTAHYPLPWARTADVSHVGARDALLAVQRSAGFDILAVDDETEAHLELARRMRAAGRVPTAEHTQANEVVLGVDFAERRANYIRSLADGLIESTVVEARRPA